MSYLVLARKYRPQRFDEIVGQEHVTDTLKSAIAQGRLHHAFLFCGARGVGKTTSARILAKALSCEKGPAPEPCNECEACREITSGQSVDVQEIDAASNNGVDNIRDLRDAIRYAPVRGRKKVFILDEVHMLSSGAWNALLKTLEEPPPHAVFVFATTDPHKLPATILSRVQRYNFRLVPARRVAEHLGTILGKESITAEPGALMLLARESGGSIRDSLSLADQVLASAHGETLSEVRVADVLGVADRALVAGLLAHVVDKQPDHALRLIDDAYQRGYDLVQLAHTLLGALRDLVVVVAVKDAAALVDGSPDELEGLRTVATRAPATLPEILFQRFSVSVESIEKASQPRHALEVGIVELCRAEPLEPISGLLERLGELEASLGEGGVLPAVAGPAASDASIPARPPAPVAMPSPVASKPVVNPPIPVAHAPVAAVPAPVVTPAPIQVAPSVGGFAQLAEALMEAKPRLSILAQGRCMKFTAEHLTLAFDREFDAEAMRDRVELLREGLRERTGTNPTIEIVVGSTEDVTRTENLIEVEQRKVVQDREHRRRESLDHPARKLLDDRFGGTWKDPVVVESDDDERR